MFGLGHRDEPLMAVSVGVNAGGSAPPTASWKLDSACADCDAARMSGYSVVAIAGALSVDPGDVRAVLVDADEDPLPGWAVTDVHRYLDPHGERVVPDCTCPMR